MNITYLVSMLTATLSGMGGRSTGTQNKVRSDSVHSKLGYFRHTVTPIWSPDIMASER